MAARNEVLTMLGRSGPVTREHVQWAYRTFLDREPESEEVITAHMAAADLGELARHFVTSAEFRLKHSLPATLPRLLPLDVEGLLVDVDIDANSLGDLIDHVRRSWEFLGRERPHYSVLTHQDFMPNAIQDNEAAFWTSGEREAESVVRVLKRNGVMSTSDLTCIDFGCGVGRVTAPLAERFASVHAYDISVPHIEIAKTRTNKATFHVVRELPLAFVGADVFHSRIVLQHNPPPIIAILIQNALQCLKPDGIAVFQVPTYALHYSFDAQRYLNQLSRKIVLDMEMHCLPQRHVFQIAMEAGCRILEVREDESAESPGRMVSNTFVIQRPRN